MTTNGLLNFLDGAPYGAFAVNMNKTILFWNRSAERILEHKADQAIGRSCCEVIAEVTQNGNEPICADGCPSVAFAKQGHVPAVLQVDALSASGKRTPITITPLIVPADQPEQRVLVMLFHELLDKERAGRIATTVGDVLSASRPLRGGNGPAPDKSALDGSLTARELEVLQLIASGLSTEEIAVELRVSSHTVLNHTRSIRSKLGVQDRIGTVVAGLRLGLL